MSKVTSTKIVGQIFKPIVTDLTYNELDEIREKNQSINITNSIIFSVPTKNDISNGVEDIAGESSIWITDYNGNLQPITFPHNQLKEIIDYYNNHIINVDIKVLSSVDWYTTTQVIESYVGTIPNIDNNLILSYENGKSDIAKASSIKIYTDDLGTVYDSNLYWYSNLGNSNEPRKYYIKGIVLFDGQEYETKNYIQCIIKPINKETPNVNKRFTIYSDGTITIVFTPNVAGKIHLDYPEDLTILQQPSETTYWSANTALIYKFKNDTDHNINGLFIYNFTPRDTNQYDSIEETFVTEEIPKPKPTVPYYFYIGTTPINSSSTIGNPAGAGEVGWHLIGTSIDNINNSNRALDGSDPANNIVVEPTYSTPDGIDFYIVIPEELNIYDGLNNNLNSIYTFMNTFTLNEITYKMFKAHDYEFIFNIY